MNRDVEPLMSEEVLDLPEFKALMRRLGVDTSGYVSKFVLKLKFGKLALVVVEEQPVDAQTDSQVQPQAGSPAGERREPVSVSTGGGSRCEVCAKGLTVFMEHWVSNNHLYCSKQCAETAKLMAANAAVVRRLMGGY